MADFKGLYVVIEGGDGTGKTTQLSLLYRRLIAEGYPVHNVVIAEPGRAIRLKSDDMAKSLPEWTDDELAKHIDHAAGYDIHEIIKNKTYTTLDPITRLMLHTTAHRMLLQDVTVPALKDGKIVLSTRGYVSALAYQTYGDGVPEHLVASLHALCTSSRYMNPDLEIVLVADATVRQERLEKRGSDPEDVYEAKPNDFQQRVSEGYDELAKFGHRRRVDALRTKEAIHEEIWAEIMLLLERRASE